MADEDVSKMSFEEAMAELEKLVTDLDSGDVPLEQSIALYERGAQLKAHCEAKLKAAEERVEQITLDANGQPTSARPIDAG